MNWQNQIQPGSFKNVNFNTRSTNTTFGRNLISYSYLLTEDVVTQDLGRKSEQYNLEIFFIGANYMQDRDNFLNAVNNAEPGILVHPYSGQKNVYIQNYSLSESAEDGGIAFLNVTFVEAGKNKFPQITEDSNFNLINSAENLESVAFDNFVLNTIVNGVPEYTRQVIGLVSQPIFSNLLRQINLGSFVGAVTQEILGSRTYQIAYATLKANLDTLINPSSSFLADTRNFAGFIIDTFNLINETGPNGKSANKVLKETQNVSYPTVSEYTSVNKAQNGNAKATARLIETAGFANKAKSVTNMTFESRQEANQIKNDLVAEANTLINSSSEDSEFNALKNLKANIVRSLPPSNIDLPELKTFYTKGITSSLVFAYKIYGNIDLESDIVARNKIRHPGFIDPNKKIEAIINA
jgi:prophage DNA circulation protein